MNWISDAGGKIHYNLNFSIMLSLLDLLPTKILACNLVSDEVSQSLQGFGNIMFERICLFIILSSLYSSAFCSLFKGHLKTLGNL